MKKVLVKVSLFLIGIFLILSPFGVFALVANSQPHVYSKTYYAALVDKVNYLKSLKEEKKIVLIGGSNVAFGFDSEIIEREFPEYKVVNFGLYAMLGTKIMIDLSLEYVGNQDMVFIIPEINSQSTSLYFNPNSTLKAIEDDMDLIWKLDKNNKDSTVSSYFEFVRQRSLLKGIIEPSGVYQRANFNKYGDIHYEEQDTLGIAYRSRNRMPLHYDPSMIVDYSYTIDQDFFEYLNEINNKVLKKQAKLYYSFSPVNEMSVLEKKEAPINYYWSLRNGLAFSVIGNPNEYIIDPHYFFDSNFHLNDSGSIYRTNLFIQDVKRDILKVDNINSIYVPPEPKYPESTHFEDNGLSDNFYYEETNNGYSICGVDEKHISDTILTTSTIYNEKPVRAVSRNAFSKCKNLETLIITNNISVLKNGAFNGASALKSIYLTQTNPSEIIVDYQKGLFEEQNKVQIYVPIKSLNDYLVDYNWTNYSELIKGY